MRLMATKSLSEVRMTIIWIDLDGVEHKEFKSTREELLSCVSNLYLLGFDFKVMFDDNNQG